MWILAIPAAVIIGAWVYGARKMGQPHDKTPPPDPILGPLSTTVQALRSSAEEAARIAQAQIASGGHTAASQRVDGHGTGLLDEPSQQAQIMSLEAQQAMDTHPDLRSPEQRALMNLLGYDDEHVEPLDTRSPEQRAFEDLLNGGG